MILVVFLYSTEYYSSTALMVSPTLQYWTPSNVLMVSPTVATVLMIKPSERKNLTNTLTNRWIEIGLAEKEWMKLLFSVLLFRVLKALPKPQSEKVAFIKEIERKFDQFYPFSSTFNFEICVNVFYLFSGALCLWNSMDYSIIQYLVRTSLKSDCFNSQYLPMI